MANSEIIGAGQDKERTSCAQEEEKCTDTKCYFFAEGQGCMTSGPCVYEPDDQMCPCGNVADGPNGVCKCCYTSQI